jgi:hypothetical protein
MTRGSGDGKQTKESRESAGKRRARLARRRGGGWGLKRRAIRRREHHRKRRGRPVPVQSPARNRRRRKHAGRRRCAAAGTAARAHILIHRGRVRACRSPRQTRRLAASLLPCACCSPPACSVRILLRTDIGKSLCMPVTKHPRKPSKCIEGRSGRCPHTKCRRDSSIAVRMVDDASGKACPAHVKVETMGDTALAASPKRPKCLQNWTRSDSPDAQQY